MRLSFERQGSKYVARGGEFKITVSAVETVITSLEGFGDVDHWFREEEARLKLVGASQSQTGMGAERRLDRVNFDHVYPGIGLVCSGTLGRLEYFFTVEEEADAGAIRIELEGFERTRIAGDGSVTARTPVGEIRIHLPIVHDRFDGERRVLKGRFELRGKSRIAFRGSVN